MAVSGIILRLFALLLIIDVRRCNGFVDVRHQFELRKIPLDVKEQILVECNSTFIKFFQERRRKLQAANISNECPPEVNNCILSKTSSFMEHCNVTCKTEDGKLVNDVKCWNDNCFARATRICEDKFWRTVPTKNRKKKKKKMWCIAEIKHCYKLACMKCLGRECEIDCYGGGIQYDHLSKPHWKGYGEYKRFFPEVADISNSYVVFE